MAEQFDVVEGYAVKQSVLFSNGNGIALAENPNAPQPYVTWQFTEVDNKRDYYWGHYYSKKEDAQQNYSERVNEYHKGFGVQIVSVFPIKVEREKKSKEMQER